MRVLLVHPPLSANREVTPPLGLCTLAAWLRGQGHEIRMLDLDLAVKGLPDGQDVYRRTLVRELEDFAPAAVGVTSMYNNSLQAERIVKAAKHFDSSVVTVAGGSHFGALGRQALRRLPELDYAIEGEGEQSFARLLDTLENGRPATGIPRLHYRWNDELRSEPASGLMDLSALPQVWPSLEGIVNLSRYAATVPEGSQRRTIYIEAGRGCPFACTFCATAPFWERKYRVKPVERIIEEMRYLYEEYGYNGFMLVHDLLTVDKQFINAFSDAMIESRLPVEWMANHRTDINLRGLLPKMKTAGCWAMFFGIESASARLQKEMRKGLTREGVVSTIRGLSDLGIASTCSFVIGFPDETPAELSATMALGAELKLMGAGMVQFHRLRTWPPAPLAKALLPSKFDIASLRIEYPFLDVPDGDASVIESDPEFFAGYFAPLSQAGTFAQLAQVELFFTQAAAAAPLTVAVAGRVMGSGMMEAFYEAISRAGGVTRAEVEADPSSMLPVWFLLRPVLERWFAVDPSLEDWQRTLLRGVMTYEEQRLRFVNSDRTPPDGLAASGDNWAAFISGVDIEAIFEAIHESRPLTAAHVRETAVILACHGSNSYRAYAADAAQIPELARHPFLFQSPKASGAGSS